ncbi:hypothetical protein [Dictyobacter formicarum]|uniref:hypothetical protein n=1 Tax=Dictyobacter formicarum TaxID=2778368 RepID=UPI001916C6E2|nr:hypothetical protein [Dictyobacter formicarum]
MTLPSPDARSRRTVPRRPQMISPTYSMPENSLASSPAMSSNSPSMSASASSRQADHEHALDFATHSWDLATGGLKTLTAKRELPIRPERRNASVVPDILATSRSYMFALVIMGCVLLMLIGGGIVLFVMLQP